MEILCEPCPSVRSRSFTAFLERLWVMVGGDYASYRGWAGDSRLSRASGHDVGRHSNVWNLEGVALVLLKLSCSSWEAYSNKCVYNIHVAGGEVHESPASEQGHS